MPFRVTPAPPIEHRDSTEVTTTGRVAASVSRVRANYLGGRFGHVLASERLSALVLATAQGLWTSGVWSSSWYRHDATQWLRQEAVPPESELLGHDQIARLDLDSPLMRSIEGLVDSWAAVPEAVSPDFDPPGLEGDAGRVGRPGSTAVDHSESVDESTTPWWN